MSVGLLGIRIPNHSGKGNIALSERCEGSGWGRGEGWWGWGLGGDGGVGLTVIEGTTSLSLNTSDMKVTL